ncbi:MAG TPA: alginate lyase family protein [Armatimonadota bacterium]|jgi:hypothetical protein
MANWMALCAAAALLASAGRAGPAPEPRTGIFASRADVEAARRRAETLPWAKARKAQILSIADAWLRRDDAWIRAILPPPGSRFAYGIAGCPACGKPWKNFGANVCRLDRPKILVCPQCHKAFSLNRPEPAYDDKGDGVKVNGQTYFLRGVWNAFVADSMWSAFQPDASAVTNLGDAYALTGDSRYAHKLAVIADALGTLAPRTKGPRDFTSDLNVDMGRLQHLTSIVFRAQICLARALDLCGNAPDFQADSPTRPGRTIWMNIRQGLYENYMFVPFDTRNGNLRTLHNHEADSVRGLLVAGILFGEPDYVRWGAQSAAAFLDNTIDRDGLYYETSLSYTAFTRSVFISMADALAAYDPERYPEELKMPRRADLPYGGNLFNNRRLARLTLDAPDRLDILGRQPTFGNNHWDTAAWLKAGRPFVPEEFEQAERFMALSTDASVRERARAVVAAGAASAEGASHSTWALYHQPDVLPAGGARPEADAPDLMNNTSLVFLRSGEGANRRGAVLRSGSNLPHSHNDEAGLLLFAQGRALSGDIGYGIFGNHVHLGWATQAIAHNLVVVNQDASASGMLFRTGPGGAVERFYAGPSVCWAETSLTGMFPRSDGVRDYRRLVMQVDVSPEASYWVDLFDVDGGHVHDYSFHARPVGDGGSFEISAPVAPIPGVWTLAALDPANRSASYNAFGRAWGERLTAGGVIRKLPGVTDEVPENPWWFAPPGNGYGFLYDVKAVDTHAPWTADWRFEEKGERYLLRVFALPEGSQKVITAAGPTLTGADKMQWVVARRGDPAGTAPVRSRFAFVMAAGGAECPVTSVEPILEDGRAAGLTVRSGDREDRILDARHAPAPGLKAGLGIVRHRGGALDALVLSGGPRLASDGFALEIAAPRYRGVIAGVDDASGAFRVSPPLSRAAAGSLLVVRGKGYARATTYRVGRASPDGVVTPLRSDITLARGRVEGVKDGGFTSSAPLPYANVQETPTRAMDGKRVAYGKATGHILAVSGFKGLRVAGPKADAGAAFTVYDVQAGDTVEMDAAASLSREAGGEWTARANGPCRVGFPWPVERWSGGRWKKAGRTADVTGTARFRQAR